MTKEDFQAILLFPFSEWVIKEWERLSIAWDMLDEAQEFIDPKDPAFTLISYAKFLIHQVREDLKHFNVTKVYHGGKNE